ncbi:MAG: hypothetical protein U0941_14465 [Planctomycetaceae bacterium]
MEIPKDVERLLRDHGVPDSNLPRERRRATIRAQQQMTKGIVGGIGGGLLMTISITFRAAIGSQSTYEIVASAVMLLVATLLILYCVRVAFRFLEDRRLNSEFPDADQA